MFEVVEDVALELYSRESSALDENAQLNKLDNLTVVEAAVCDCNGFVEFESKGFSVTNSISKAGDEHSIKVKAITLDNWAQDHKPPDVLMMDIEGAELDAMHGAHSLIREYRPIMLIEVHWLGQEFVDYVDKRLKPLGYKATTYFGEPLPTEKMRCHALITPA